MGTQKFNSDIDVNGEVKGTSLDINGNVDISGTTTVIAPTANLHAATKAYVDGAVIPQRAVSDSVTSTSTTTAASSAAVKAAKDTANTAGLIAVAALPKAGGTMTGKITLDGAPSSNLHAATKAYVDGAVIANTDTQDLTISGQTLSLTNGGSVTLPDANTDTNVDVSTLETRLGQINSSITIGNGGTVTTTTSGPLIASSLITSPTSKIGLRNLDWAGTSEEIENAQGDVIYHSEATTTIPGAIYYMTNDGNIALADADTVGTSSTLLVVALANHSGKGLLLRGVIRLATNPEASTGHPIYLSTVSGRAQNTAPSATGDVVRVLGYQLTTSESSVNTCYFNPDNTWVELT
jgi:hypothetical protein